MKHAALHDQVHEPKNLFNILQLHTLGRDSPCRTWTWNWLMGPRTSSAMCCTSTMCCASFLIIVAVLVGTFIWLEDETRRGIPSGITLPLPIKLQDAFIKLFFPVLKAWPTESSQLFEYTSCFGTPVNC